MNALSPTSRQIRFWEGVTAKGEEMWADQEGRWGHLNPELFERLIEHEKRQHDWFHQAAEGRGARA